MGIGGGFLGVIGGAASLAKQSSNSRDAAAAARFQPFDVNGPAGNATFEQYGPYGSQGGRATFTPSENVSGLLSGVEGASQTQLNLGASVGTNLQGIAANGPGIVDPATGQIAPTNIRDTFLNAQNFLGNAPGPEFSTQGSFGQQAAGDVGSNLFNQQTLAGLVDPTRQGFNNMAAGGLDLAGQQQTAGMGLLNRQVGNFDAIAAQTTANLRAGAQPGNERAAASLADRLFSGGQLGSTGGANQFGRLAEAQNLQDLGFQNAGFNQATALRGQDITRVLGQQGIGSNLLAGSNQTLGNSANIFGQGVDSTLALTQGQLPFQQNTGAIANQFTNESVQNFGIDNSRANQLLGNATNLFGFGQGAVSGGLNAGVQGLGAAAGVQGMGNNTIALGANIGGIRSDAGANAGNFIMQDPSVAGGIISSIGGMFDGAGI